MPAFSKVMFGSKKREERKRMEWNGEEGRRNEWKRVVKLNFVVWFNIKFGKKMNYNFFL